jgi:hypothetical protein
MVARLKPNIRRLAEIEHTRKICVHSRPEKGEIQMDSARVEELAAQFHEVYQKELKRQNVADRYPDKYEELSEPIKDIDRALARFVLAHNAELWTQAQEQMRAKASQHIPWDYGKCSCGFRWRKIDSTNPCGDLQEHIRSIPLDPLPAGDAGEPDWDAIQKNERISEGYDDTPNNLGADQE